ncbi:MAG TPA: heme ABC transporter permease CcmB [Actinobacteria bacterium]|nr:heme ABC transporter permease CcmB [Actinomycetota bacterium]
MLPFRQMWIILKKDILLELRTKEMIVSMLLFVMLTMVIFNYAFAAEKNDLTTFGGGLLWVAFIFTSFLGLNRSFVHEKDEGCLEGLLLSPVDRSIIYVAKMLGNLIFITVVQLAAVPIFTIFFIRYPYYIYWSHVWPFVIGLGLSSFGIAGVGTFVATLAANTKRRDLLLPILGLPLLMPVLAPAVIISGTMMGGPVSERAAELVSSSMQILIAYDIVCFIVIAMIYDFVLGE